MPDSLTPTPGRRIVLTTFGSLGDLHPYIALAQGLQARGHSVVIATSALYREKIEILGIGFHPVRPEMPDIDADPKLMELLMDARKGTEVIVRDMIMPAVRESYEDTLAVARDADLLVSHVITYSTRLVAEKLHKPWASSMLAPIGFLSAHDPPVLTQAPFLARLRWLGAFFHRGLFGLMKWSIRSWAAPWHHLRQELGLPPTSDNPIFEGQHSPQLVLAMFSELLGAKQRDWPAATVVTGFPFYDHHDGVVALAPELTRFLDEGEPPIVFTLGSSAVMAAGSFYEQAARAAQLLGRRAILLIGPVERNRPAALPPGVAAFEYAPYSQLFPHAAATVHQGGVGTTAQALRSGKPTLVVPFAHDQPDNAARVTRLGVGRTLARTRSTAANLAAELRELLENPRYAQRAAEVGRQIQQEDGVGAACAALERLLESRANR